MEKNMAVSELPLPWKLTETIESGFLFKPPETPVDPMEFLSRSWNVSAFQLSSSLGSNSNLILSNPTISGLLSGTGTILEDGVGESVVDDTKVPVGVCGNPFESTQVIVDRIMSQSQEASPRNSARSSHSSGVMVSGSSSSSLPGSPPISPSELDRFKNFHLNIAPSSQHRATASTTVVPATASSSGKTVGRWLKDRREKKKEEIRAQNAQLHSAVSVAGVAAAVAAIAAASASSTIKDQELARTHMALASAATLVAAQCVEAAESMGAERDHLTSVVSSAVNVRSADNIMTLTAAAATALRGAATVKARALKEGSNIAAALPMEKGMASNNSSHSDELVIENFRGISSKKLLARGCELLKRTRKGELHWKIVCLYINRMNQVTLKMKSRHVAGTITKKKKYIVLEVVKNMPAWAGRYLLEGGENRRYFGFKTADRGLIEFECRNQREYEAWTGGVSRLLTLAAERSNMARM